MTKYVLKRSHLGIFMFVSVMNLHWEMLVPCCVVVVGGALSMPWAWSMKARKSSPRPSRKKSLRRRRWPIRSASSTVSFHSCWGGGEYSGLYPILWPAPNVYTLYHCLHETWFAHMAGHMFVDFVIINNRFSVLGSKQPGIQKAYLVDHVGFELIHNKFCMIICHSFPLF